MKILVAAIGLIYLAEAQSPQFINNDKKFLSDMGELKKIYGNRFNFDNN